MSQNERAREIAKLEAELAALVELSNAEGDGVKRAALMREIRSLRTFLRGLPGSKVGGAT